MNNSHKALAPFCCRQPLQLQPYDSGDEVANMLLSVCAHEKLFVYVSRQVELTVTYMRSFGGCPSAAPPFHLDHPDLWTNRRAEGPASPSTFPSTLVRRSLRLLSSPFIH